ncbi:flagellar hook capping FlgD N-terminal domain-containing protein [Castellaniella sp. GW247-6E4]|uniref:flagellar hook capping FlgD N-terminal domain-containing protein n=1 Tax=Castellaniella sp. GW247-6E4 TaxID=3140380 RepID=UPI0033156E6D
MTTVAGTSASNTAALANAQTKSLMGDTQDRFLTLLVTQLQNQDPLNPMDNAQVTSQIAQLSTVNGIQQLNNTLLAVSGQMDMSQSLQAAALIGKQVLVPGQKVSLGSDPGDPSIKAATPFGIDLISGSSKTTVSIVDASGALIRKLDLGALDAGVYPLTWDGKDSAGAPVADGAYSVQVAAADADGQPVTAQALTSGTVGSVAYTSEGLRLDLGLAGKISLLDIRQIM